MAVKIYENGAWRNATQVKRVDSGAWQDVGSANRYENGAWNKVWPTEVQVGDTVSFVSTPVPGTTRIDGNRTAKVGYFSKPLTPGFYEIWADRAYWYWMRDSMIEFSLRQDGVGYCYTDAGVHGRFNHIRFGYVGRSNQTDSGGNNWDSITMEYKVIKVTGTGIVRMYGGSPDDDLISNEWGYNTLEVTDARMTKLSNL